MVYAYDRNIQMPTKDLYDTQIMAMALNVAKDEYNRAEKRLDDLTKMYSDFYSPSDVDMASWQTEVVDPIKSKIDELYARGIDPLRSAEGHALLAKVSRNLPYDDINKLKQSSKVLQKNLENAAELQAKGLYDPEYVKFLDRDPKTWNTLKRGVFQWASPSPAYSMEQLISPMYKDRQARPLTQEEVEGEGIAYDPMKNYTGFLKSDIRKMAEENLPAFLNTPDGQYQKQLAAQQVANESGIRPEDVDDADANAKLLDNMIGAAARFYIGPNGEVDKIKLEDRKLANRLAAKGLSLPGVRSSYSGSYGGGTGNGYGNVEYGYSSQVRLFNEGVANLLGTKVDVVNNELTSNSNIFNKLHQHQGDVFTRRTKNGVVNFDRALDDLSISQTPEFIANILNLKQTDDEDKKNSFYSLPKEELRNIITGRDLVHRVQNSGMTNSRTTATTDKIVAKYKKYADSEIKIVPTTRVLTYLDKDGTIKQYAKVKIKAASHDQNGNIINSDSDYVYIDLGNTSTAVKNGDDNGRGPVAINWGQSTLRTFGYQNEDKRVSSNQTKHIYSSYNN